MAEPPKNDIPLAYLPVLASIAGIAVVSVSTGVLLGLLCHDVWRSFKRKTPWVPGKSLLLGALSLTLLQLMDRSLINISNAERLNISEVENLKETINEKQVLMVGGKVVLCVFMAYLLPAVARPRGWELWRDMIALIISVVIAVCRTAYEIYIVVVDRRLDLGDHFKLTEIIVSFVVADVIIMISMLLLLSHLVCAILACHGIQDMTDLRTPLLLKDHKIIQDENRAPCEWRQCRETLLKVWIVSRSWQPRYIIARSVLSSSTVFIVTLCVVIFLSELRNCGNSDQGKTYDWSFVTSLPLQAIFIIFAWGVIWWRWLTAMVYNPRFMRSNIPVKQNLRGFFKMEDFWVRVLLDVRQDLKNPLWLRKRSTVTNVVLRIVKTLKLYKLVSVLVFLQCLLVFFSKVCWLLSELMFSHKCARRLIMGNKEYDEFCRLYEEGIIRLGSDKRDPLVCFKRYSESLLFMPGENPAGVWMANLRSVDLFVHLLEKGRNKGEESEALKSLIQQAPRNHKLSRLKAERYVVAHLAPDVETAREFDVGYNSSKMTVISLLTVMVELSNFYDKVNVRRELDGSDFVGNCMKACEQAWPILDFVENSVQDAAAVSRAADRLFEGLNKPKGHRWWLEHKLPMNSSGSLEDIEGSVKELMKLGKAAADGECKVACRDGGFDSKDWTLVMAGRNLCRVCNELLHSYHNKTDRNMELFLREIHAALACVIDSSIWKVVDVFNDRVEDWSKRKCLDEDEVWDICNIIALTLGLQNCPRIIHTCSFQARNMAYNNVRFLPPDIP